MVILQKAHAYNAEVVAHRHFDPEFIDTIFQTLFLFHFIAITDLNGRVEPSPGFSTFYMVLCFFSSQIYMRIPMAKATFVGQEILDITRPQSDHVMFCLLYVF